MSTVVIGMDPHKHSATIEVPPKLSARVRMLATGQGRKTDATDAHSVALVAIMAVVQLRHRGSEGRAYFDRKLAAGKTPMEAMRCLKRRLSDVVYRQMIADTEPISTGPGGHSGTTLQSSVTGPTPIAGSSDKPLPGPADRQPRALPILTA